MKYLKNLKKFKESKFVSEKEADQILDKINDSGMNSLSDYDKKRLSLYSDDDKEVLEIIDRLAELTTQIRKLNTKMDQLSKDNKDEESKRIFDNEWSDLNDKIRDVEDEFEKYGIELGEDELTDMMISHRPDVYGFNENLSFIKQPKKKGANTEVFNVSKGAGAIGQIKWSSRNRGYAFLPTPDCDSKVKEFIKELMKKRREDKKK